MKGCALGLILEVRVFGTRKWPIILLELLLQGPIMITQNNPLNSQCRKVNTMVNWTFNPRLALIAFSETSWEKCCFDVKISNLKVLK